ncbi:unnamed protein product [Ilex paraguariensis]|uniref:BHLH domain-containing protein n=1 Tax=Ilex paraguariensis TaxID=185542 RepID=A0ABC8U5M5_9AQUA
MDSFEGNNSWDLIDYSSFIDDVASTDLYWTNQSANVELDASLTRGTSQENECAEKEYPRKRGRSDHCSRQGTKACRERQRRERLNDRFTELCSVLEPGRPAKTDKLAILGDAIRVLNQLRTESQEYKEKNEKLLEEIKTLKADKNELREEKLIMKVDKERLEQQLKAMAADKNELREEKLIMKADKERLEQQLKAMAVPPAGFMPAHPAAYQSGANKMPVFPSYGFIPMWQYLPPTARDTSQDHELRPPAA